MQMMKRCLAVVYGLSVPIHELKGHGHLQVYVELGSIPVSADCAGIIRQLLKRAVAAGVLGFEGLRIGSLTSVCVMTTSTLHEPDQFACLLTSAKSSKFFCVQMPVWPAQCTVYEMSSTPWAALCS